MIFRLFVYVLMIPAVLNTVSAQLYPYKREGKWGYMNSKGQKVINPQFFCAYRYSEGIAAVCTEDGRFGFVDIEGNWLINPQYEEAGIFQAGISRVRVNEKWGLIGRKGNWIEMPIYPDSTCLRYIGEGWWALGYQGRNGLVNYLGKRLNIPDLHWFDKFVNGFCALSCGYSKMGYLNREGKFITEMNLHLPQAPYGFYSERARVVVNQKIGYLDIQGKICIPPQFAYADNFSEGVAVVRRTDFGPAQFIRKDGSALLADEFEWASAFNFGLAYVKQRNSHGLIDTKGKWKLKLVDPQKKVVKWSAHLCLIWNNQNREYQLFQLSKSEYLPLKIDGANMLPGGYWAIMTNLGIGLLNPNGEILLKPTSDEIIALGLGLFQFRFKDKVGLLDSTGKILLPPNYASIALLDNLIQVEQETALWGFYDLTGKLMLKPLYTEALPFQQGRSLVRLPDEFNAKLINQQGKTLKEVPFQRIAEPSAGLYRIEYQKKFGFMDGNGKVVIPANLLFAEPFREGYSIAGQLGANGKDTLWGLLNVKGKWVIEPSPVRITSYQGGLATAIDGAPNKEIQWGYLNIKGEWAFKRRFSQAEPFFEDYALIRQHNINEFTPTSTSGEELITKNGKTTISFNSNVRPVGGVGGGLITVIRNDSLGWMNLSGQWVVPPKWPLQPGQEEVQAFSGGRLAIRQNGFWGYLKPDGNWAIPPRFLHAEPYHAGYARVQTPTGWGLVDTAGKWVLPPVQYQIGNWAEGAVSFTGRGQGQRIGYLDRAGKKVWPLLP